MKAQQFVFVFVLLLLAFESYALPNGCLIELKGQFKHQTGDGTSGCFGLDPSDAIKKLKVGKPGIKWTLFSDFGCNGNVVAHGVGKKKFTPSVTAFSVKITCP
ncbi:7224_t:CDS:2 [Paraglomus occultum]|uniref:7224_t:CDS:1 n=1 Tax=Paraglomus occultum TaxID=144539 RepID=A0A9N8ZXH7_9GLOM|nr:7224_t:CDS:2 [Paraglomus occultum]